MKRLTFIHEDGTAVIWQAQGFSWGDASRNVVLRDAKLVQMNDQHVTNPRQVDFVLIPLTGIKSMQEEEW